MGDTLDWAIFQRIFGYGTTRSQKVLDAVGHPSELLSTPVDHIERLRLLAPRELAAVSRLSTLTTECGKLLEIAYRLGCTVLTPDSDSYPNRLRNIYSAPSVLYVLGSLEGFDKAPSIGMVGTRRHTEYGSKVADELSFGLASVGVTVVSGLAAGIDTISHKAALRASGRTVAVLGCGPDTVYPITNTDLHEAIIKSGGAVVTEFPPTEKPLAFHFPIRNRVISGLSLGVVVVEGSRHSGSLITAGHAVTQDREVFAVPGSIYSQMSQATNWLITQGATMATSVDDILSQFPYLDTIPQKNNVPEQISFDIPESGVYNDTVPSFLSDNQSKVLRAITAEPMTADAILAKTELPLPAVLASLTQLEIFGLINALAGRRFCRK